MSEGAYATPNCPECGARLTVGEFITARTADCHHCGSLVTVDSMAISPNRDVSTSPAVQKDSKKF